MIIVTKTKKKKKKSQKDKEGMITNIFKSLSKTRKKKISSVKLSYWKSQENIVCYFDFDQVPKSLISIKFLSFKILLLISEKYSR